MKEEYKDRYASCVEQVIENYAKCHIVQSNADLNDKNIRPYVEAFKKELDSDQVTINGEKFSFPQREAKHRFLLMLKRIFANLMNAHLN